jgi:hypothetical protein
MRNCAVTYLRGTLLLSYINVLCDLSDSCSARHDKIMRAGNDILWFSPCFSAIRAFLAAWLEWICLFRVVVRFHCEVPAAQLFGVEFQLAISRVFLLSQARARTEEGFTDEGMCEGCVRPVQWAVLSCDGRAVISRGRWAARAITVRRP